MLDVDLISNIGFYRNIILNLPDQNWRGHLVIMYYLLQDLEADTLATAKDDVKPKTLYCTFCFLPVFTIKAKQLHITCSILKDMDFQICKHDNAALTVSQLWLHYFPGIPGVLKNKQEFKNNMRSDGVNVSLFVCDTLRPVTEHECKTKKQKTSSTEDELPPTRYLMRILFWLRLIQAYDQL